MIGTGSKYYKRFDPEFKREMVRLVEELGKSPSEVAREVGVSPATIRRWIKAFGVKGDAAFPGKGNLYPADEEIRRREQRIKELEEENAILKKAMAIVCHDADAQE
jgi:transposase